MLGRLVASNMICAGPVGCPENTWNKEEDPNTNDFVWPPRPPHPSAPPDFEILELLRWHLFGSDFQSISWLANRSAQHRWPNFRVAQERNRNRKPEPSEPFLRETLWESGRCTDVSKKRRKVLKKRGRVLKKKGEASEEGLFSKGTKRWVASSEGAGGFLRRGGSFLRTLCQCGGPEGVRPLPAEPLCVSLIFCRIRKRNRNGWNGFQKPKPSFSVKLYCNQRNCWNRKSEPLEALHPNRNRTEPGPHWNFPKSGKEGFGPHFPPPQKRALESKSPHFYAGHHRENGDFFLLGTPFSGVGTNWDFRLKSPLFLGELWPVHRADGFEILGRKGLHKVMDAPCWVECLQGCQDVGKGELSLSWESRMGGVSKKVPRRGF